MEVPRIKAPDCRDGTIMGERGQHEATPRPGDTSQFRLPPEVSFEKRRLGDGWAYVFRHRTLGELGRVVLQDRGDGRCQVICEVVGDPADPMTARRAEVFQPLGLELAARIETATGPAATSGLAAPPPRPPEPGEIIESRIIPCERCGAPVALLVFAPEATGPGQFDDHARKMFPEYTRLNLPTWIIGPALGDGPLMDRPADILKVWPAREPLKRLRPAEFNPILDRLAASHCG
jgi:hypothetical protein